MGIPWMLIGFAVDRHILRPLTDSQDLGVSLSGHNGKPEDPLIPLH